MTNQPSIPRQDWWGYWLITGENFNGFVTPIPGDQILTYEGSWDLIPLSLSDGFLGFRKYRRLIPLGEGYELVELDDYGQEEADEFTCDGINWDRISFHAARSIRSIISDHPQFLAIRRKKVCAGCNGHGCIEVSSHSGTVGAIPCPDCQPKEKIKEEVVCK